MDTTKRRVERELFGKETLKGYVDKVSESIENFDPKSLWGWIEERKVYDNYRQWNKEFCKDIMGLEIKDLTAGEQMKYAAALQIYLADHFFQQKKKDIFQTRRGKKANPYIYIDGKLGGYTMSVFAEYWNNKYFNEDYKQKNPDNVKLGHSKLSKRLEGKPGNKKVYDAALAHLRKQLGGSEAVPGSPEKAEELAGHLSRFHIEKGVPPIFAAAILERHPEFDLQNEEHFKKAVAYMDKNKDKRLDKEAWLRAIDEVDGVKKPKTPDQDEVVVEDPGGFREAKPGDIGKFAHIITEGYEDRMRMTDYDFEERIHDAQMEEYNDFEEKKKGEYTLGKDPEAWYYTRHSSDILGVSNLTVRKNAKPRRAFADFRVAYKELKEARTAFSGLDENSMKRLENAKNAYRDSLKNLKQAIDSYRDDEINLSKFTVRKYEENLKELLRKHNIPANFNAEWFEGYADDQFDRRKLANGKAFLPLSIMLPVARDNPPLNARFMSENVLDMFDADANKSFKNFDEIKTALKKDPTIQEQFSKLIKGVTNVNEITKAVNRHIVQRNYRRFGKDFVTMEGQLFEDMSYYRKLIDTEDTFKPFDFKKDRSQQLLALRTKK